MKEIIEDNTNKDIKITEKELEIIYNILNLDWDDMTEESREVWTKVLHEIEESIHLEKQNKDEKEN